MPPEILEQSAGHYRLALQVPVDDREPAALIALDDFLNQHGRRCWTAPELSWPQAGLCHALLRVYPHVTLPELELTLEVPPMQQVDEPLLQSHLIDLQFQHAQRETVTRPARQGDLVTLDWYTLVQNQPEPGLAAVGTQGRLNPELLPLGLWRHAVGLKAGESKTVRAILPNEADSAVNGRPAQIVLTIQQVQALELPPLDDSFPALCGQPDWPSLFAQLNQSLQELYLITWRKLVREALIYRLSELAELEMPQDLFIAEQFSSWKNGEGRLLEQLGLSEAQREAAWQSWQKSPTGMQEVYQRLRSTLVVREVVNQQAITLTPDEVMERLTPFEFEGGPPLSEIYAELENSGQLHTMIDLLLGEKVVNLLLERATLTFEGEILPKAA